MTLLDVLQVAIRQSPTLNRAVVDLDVARAAALEAQGLDDFTFTVTGIRSRTQTPVASSPGVVGMAQRDVTGLDVGLERGLSTGATVRATVLGQHVTDEYRPDIGPAAELFSGILTSASASIVQPILRGAGAKVARANVRRAKVVHDVATLQQTAEALNVTRDVIIAYWQVAYARQVIAIRTDSLKLAVDQLGITERAVRTGSVSPTEGLAAEQAIAVREQALLLAQVELSQLSLDLRRTAGLELGKDQIDLAPTTPLETPTETFDTEATIARALERNPNLALLEARKAGANIDVEVTEDAIRPRLDVQAMLGTTGRSAKVSEAIKQLASVANPSFTIAVGYEQQLGAHGARGANARAKATRRGVDIDLALARREVVVSVTHAIDVLRAAQKRIEVSDRAISLAKRNLEIEQTRFRNAKSTNFDVLLRQDALQQISVSRALAVTDALAAVATVQALTGDLLDQSHIRIAPP